MRLSERDTPSWWPWGKVAAMLSAASMVRIALEPLGVKYYIILMIVYVNL